VGGISAGQPRRLSLLEFLRTVPALAPQARPRVGQEHKAGEKLFVDWVGTTIPIHDPRGGPVQEAHLFGAVLGASSYTYAEATPDEQLASWIGADVRAFEFYQGEPLVPLCQNSVRRQHNSGKGFYELRVVG